MSLTYLLPCSPLKVLHSGEHDHEDHLINSTHGVAEFWFGKPAC